MNFPGLFLWKGLLSSIFIVATLLNATRVSATDEPLAQSLIQKSNELGLSSSRYWHLLLHYQSGVIGNALTSAVDDPKFFLSKNGKHDPQAELEATIRYLFTQEEDNHTNSHVDSGKCSFLARYYWLKEQLFLDLPVLVCSEYDDWIEKIDPESVSFIFASAYMNTPTSMFGHTFLRINKKGKAAFPLLAATTVDYVASVTSQNSLAIMFAGMFGAYKGYFNVIPYHLKVRTYTDIQNRDIWEYPLNLNDIQIAKMLRHVWELQGVYFNYYYFTENCSYNILYLLQLANEDLHLTESIEPWVYPLDTVHRLIRQEELVGRAVGRPSGQAQIMKKYSVLSAKEKLLFKRIIERPEELDWILREGWSEDRLSVVIDTATDYIKYQTLSKWTRESHDINRWKRYFDLKVQLKYSQSTDSRKIFSQSPERAHKTSRTGFGLGWKNGQPFEELYIRGGYHDWLDDPDGYPPDSQLELMALTLRHHRNGNVSVKELDLVDVVSLIAYDPLFVRPSWKLRLGLGTFDHKDCEDCYIYQLNHGIGMAARTDLYRQEVVFGFVETDLNYAEIFKRDFRVGSGVTVGVLAEITKNWKMLASGTYLTYYAGDNAEDVKFTLQHRVSLNKNNALRLSYDLKEKNNEVKMSYNYYF